MMPATRALDRWFIDEVLPHEARYLAVACRLTQDADMAADLVQEALVKVLALDGWSAIANPRAYVIRSIHNLAVEQIRRARIVRFQQLSELDTLDLRDDAPDAYRVAAGRDQVVRLSAALDGLPERCRTVFVRRRFREQPAGEIASDLGISLSTFEKRLARALHLLTRALEPGDKPLDEHAADQDSETRAAR
jgi:RNA polymerase sigma factor (sigma-70 family)